MKTNLFKINLTIALLGIAMGVIGQPATQKKISIKIDQNVNGKEIKIDTSFTGLNEAEIKNQLSKFGVNDMPEVNDEMDSGNLLADASGVSKKNKVIVINDDEGENNGEEGGSAEIFPPKGDSAVKTEIIIKNYEKDENGAENKLSSKIVRVENLTYNDSNALKSDISTTDKPFSELRVYPVPTEDNLNILYKTVGAEPMLIHIYDLNGSIVYSEKINNTNSRVSKTISLSSLSPGAYFVQLAQGNQTEVKKVVVK